MPRTAFPFIALAATMPFRIEPALAAPVAPAVILQHHLYHGDGVSPAGHFDPSFLKLDYENQTLFEGVDVLDADPVCQCQDNGAHYRVNGRMDGPDRYIATVSMIGEPASWQVIMHRTSAGWTFYDVIDDRGSVRAVLQRHNACARERLARHQSVDPCAELK
jgi:hypothetical protein